MKNQKFTKLNLTEIIKNISAHTSIGRLNEAADFAQKKKPVTDEEPPAEDVPSEAPAAPAPVKKASVPPSPDKQAQPPSPDATPAPDATPEAEPSDTPQEPEVDNNDPTADSEVAQAEDEIEQPTFVKLNSDSGVKFLLNSILQPAIETNTLDSISQDFIDKLKINTAEDLQKFKAETIQFRSVAGFNQLISSMENFIA